MSFLNKRPIYKLKNRGWQRIDAQLELKGCSVKWNGFFYVCSSAKELVGVDCYYCFIEDVLHVFDFSSSHLCPNQLQRIELHANVS